MVFNLYRIVNGAIKTRFNCGYYKTDAPEAVVEEIVEMIETDNKINIEEFGNSVVSILKARGYKCEEYDVKIFGYIS